jgi:hypothetical protein
MRSTGNPYDNLKVDPCADHAAIRSAFRKQARSCHPDKIRNAASCDTNQFSDSSAFLELCEALECLLDDGRRQALDAQLCAAREREKQQSELDARTREFRARLEEREANAVQSAAEESEYENHLRELRREAAVLLEDSRNDIVAALSGLHLGESKCEPIIKAKWAKSGGDSVLYTEDLLGKMFSKYGEVAHIVTRSRRALIEFKDLAAAKMAFNYECGLPASPLKLSALFSDTDSRYITVQCARTGRSLLDFEAVIIDKLMQHRS